MENEFPYKKFESTVTWNVLNQAIEDLIENTDIVVTTDRRYIVGYICNALFDAEITYLDAEKDSL